MEVPHVLLAGGGTAGHLFPGLAVAERLRETAPAMKITFAGSGKAFERHCAQRAGFNYVAIPCRPLPRGPRDAVDFVTTHVKGYYLAARFLNEHRVSLVIGLGGYASAPMVRAALRQRVRCVLLEQNAIPGRATRWFSPSATVVCAAFDEIRPHLRSGARLRVTGNPVRREFDCVAAAGGARNLEAMQPRRKLLIVGGSSGAKSLNDQLPLALYKAGPALKDWNIVHQTGPRGDVVQVRALYEKLGLRATVTPFIDDLPPVLSECDFVVSRAGGTTLAELAVCGVPAILVPYPHAADDHQRANAALFAAAGAGKIVDEHDPTDRMDNRLAAVIAELAGQDELRYRMSAAMLRLSRPRAASAIAKIVADILRASRLAGVA